MSSEGVGDGAGVAVDLSVRFFLRLTGRDDLAFDCFGVANAFLPRDPSQHERAGRIIEHALADEGMAALLVLPNNYAVLAMPSNSRCRGFRAFPTPAARPSRRAFENRC